MCYFAEVVPNPGEVGIGCLKKVSEAIERLLDIVRYRKLLNEFDLDIPQKVIGLLIPLALDKPTKGDEFPAIENQVEKFPARKIRPPLKAQNASKKGSASGFEIHTRGWE